MGGGDPDGTGYVIDNDADDDGVCDADEVVGCTIESACNYEASTTDEDNDSCTYAEELYDCAGNCQNDADGDEVCDENEILGCTDSSLCNYDASATDDDGSCYEAEQYKDCDGVCLNDADGNGVCNEAET